MRIRVFNLSIHENKTTLLENTMPRVARNRSRYRRWKHIFDYPRDQGRDDTEGKRERERGVGVVEGGQFGSFLSVWRTMEKKVLHYAQQMNY